MAAMMGVVLLGAASLLALTGLSTGITQRRAVARSLSSIGAHSVAPASPTVDPSLDRLLKPSVSRLAALGRRVTPQGAAARLVQQLDLAGNPTPWTLEAVYAAKAAAAATGALLAVAWLGGERVGSSILLAVAGGAAGFFLPNLLVYNTGTKRQAEIQKTLPDALDLLTISVEAGMGFDAAISHVAHHTRGPLSGEFFRVLQEMQMKSRSAAFRALGDRTNVADLRIFVSALVQADALGIPIGQVLREQAKEMRLKRRQRAEERAMKVPVKVLFPMVVFILPVLFIVVLAPAGMEIANTLKDGG